MRINKLWLKLAAATVIAAIAGIILAAVLIRTSTANGFTQYLQDARGMGQMMGGGPGGMMGVYETAYLDSVTRSLWMAGILAVAIAALIAAIFSRQITAPLRRLNAAAAKVTRGDLSGRVESVSRDEVGELSGTFNNMLESLHENQEQRRKLMGDLAHEMGTPLAVIQSNLEGMLDGVVETSPQTIASLHHESLILSRLVKDLRTLSQAESGKLNLLLAPADMGEIAAAIVKANEAEAKEKNTALTLQVDPALLRAMVDADRVSQIMTNLLTNALRYSSNGDRIEIKLGQDINRDGLLLSVADSGQGISETDLPHIFDRYYRGQQAKEKRVGGSGIGLTVVKELVEAHHGRVWAESLPGKGSTFYVWLPINQTVKH